MISLDAYGFLEMIVGIIMCVAGLLGGDVYFGVLGLGGAIVGHRAWKLKAFENLFHDVLFWAAGAA